MILTHLGIASPQFTRYSDQKEALEGTSRLVSLGMKGNPHVLSKRAIEDIAYAVLLLEKQLKSYQALHEEEIKALWEALEELKARVLNLGHDTQEGSYDERSPGTKARGHDSP